MKGYIKGFKRLLLNLFRARLKVYKTCEELPLWNFLKAVNTGEYRYLCKDYDRDIVNNEYLTNLYGDLILEFGMLSKDMRISSYFDFQKVIMQLENLYIVVNAMLRTLLVITPGSKNQEYAEIANTYISDLNKLGYHVKYDTEKNYTQSIKDCMQKSKGILTQVRMKKAEQKLNMGDEENEIYTFDKAMAWMSGKYSVPENINVARYCEIKNIIASKNK